MRRKIKRRNMRKGTEEECKGLIEELLYVSLGTPGKTDQSSLPYEMSNLSNLDYQRFPQETIHHGLTG